MNNRLAQVRRCIKDWNLIQLPVVEPFMPSPSPTLSDDWELVSTPSEPEAIPRYTPSDPALIEYNKKPLLSIAIPNPRQNSTKIQKRRPSSTTDRLKQTCHHGSGPSPSQTGGRRLPPSRTRGEGSGDSQGCEDGGDRKRQRRISGGNSEGASGGDGGNGSASNWSGNTGKDPYRSPNRNPDDPGDDPGDDPRDEPGDEPTPAESRDKPNFACHFYKLNPGKYGIWTDDKYKECPGSRITELRRIKYHLQTAHKMSPLYCRRCFRLFSDNAKLSEHYSARTGCEPADRPPSMNDVINDYQWERIEALFRRRGQRGVDDISRWYEIWQILFPGVKEPSNTRGR
ncbi:hypothetical protein L207DRAFT_175446 [Hyaloscypha variabilis F]|uniref:C2H2-type domain-containing protein n=1 Tax=Hyaloscypha variabilis (strain UAMH 11265 / GT02V1 / F) TaxID=1149755 RepID=A0A2J6R3M1_HYAVF|nr:hypothetical protein L207DRAFT_175446 [Hyaloscypha variabilis F]